MKTEISYGKRRDEEHLIQTACVTWFNYVHPELRGLLFAVPNGGRRNAITGARLKAEGVIPGVADLILLLPSGNAHGLLIEMKTPAGRLTTEQRKWGMLLQQAGFRYVVCRSKEDFRFEIETYLATAAQIQPIQQ